MDRWMNVQRCENMLELLAAISRWEKANTRYARKAGGVVPELWKPTMLAKIIPANHVDNIKLRF